MSPLSKEQILEVIDKTEFAAFDKLCKAEAKTKSGVNEYNAALDELAARAAWNALMKLRASLMFPKEVKQ